LVSPTNYILYYIPIGLIFGANGCGKEPISCKGSFFTLCKNTHKQIYDVSTEDDHILPLEKSSQKFI